MQTIHQYTRENVKEHFELRQMDSPLRRAFFRGMRGIERLRIRVHDFE